MRHLRIIFIIAMYPMVLWGQSDTLWIKNKGFVFQTDNKTDDDLLEAEYLNISSIDPSVTNKIRFTLKEIGGDCNSLTVEIGDYEIKDDQLILCSFWCWQGDAPVSPWGARKQIYTVNESGDLKKEASYVYIESGRAGWTENDGVEFLYTQPQTESDKRRYMDYVKKIESEYEGTFVFGKNADSLIKEVKSRFTDYLLTLKKSWRQSENSFGFKI